MEEQRKSERKLVKFKVQVALADGVLMGRSFDLGTSGVGLLLEVPLKTGAQLRVSIGLLLNGVLTPMQAPARVQYCIFSNGEYKIGCQFLTLDAAAATLLGRFLR